MTKSGGAMKKILNSSTSKMAHGMTQRVRTCWVLELECQHVAYITEMPSANGIARCPVCRPQPRPGTEQFHRMCSGCGERRRIYSAGLCSQCTPEKPRRALVMNVAALAELDALARERTAQSYTQRHYWR